jgi:fructose-1,6-bisphosphatase/inositol monophosphatase family enzyme
LTEAKREMPELTDAPTWFIDAIDGTVNFVHNFPHACISVGLTVCKEPVAGIVYDPMNSELYSAIKGRGAFMNEKPIYTSKISGNASQMQTHRTMTSPKRGRKKKRNTR